MDRYALVALGEYADVSGPGDRLQEKGRDRMIRRIQICDGPTCEELATHELLVQLPVVEREVFHLCRSHARAAASIIVRRRAKARQQPARDRSRGKLRREGITRWLAKGTGSELAPEDLDATAKRQLTTDSELNVYREVLELDDGTRLEITARLSDQQDPTASDQLHRDVTDARR